MAVERADELQRCDLLLSVERKTCRLRARMRACGTLETLAYAADLPDAATLGGAYGGGRASL